MVVPFLGSEPIVLVAYRTTSKCLEKQLMGTTVHEMDFELSRYEVPF